jgi:predicted lipoprotein with Yx(FWY)xxD motif
MARMRHSLWILGLFITMIMAACGSNAGTGSSGSSGSASTSPTATTAPAGSTPTTTGNGTGCVGRYCSNSTPTTAPSGSALIIKTATATVSGKSVTILTNGQGMTLYYRTSDTSSSVCSGGCASAWPPLLTSGSSAPTSSASLPGTLSIVQNANGSQVAYNGHPLYTFSGDKGPGQMTGRGLPVSGSWLPLIYRQATMTIRTMDMGIRRGPGVNSYALVYSSRGQPCVLPSATCWLSEIRLA